MWKQFVKDYFSFTAKERKGIIILVIIIFFLVFLPYLYPLFNKKEVYNRDEFEKEIAQLRYPEIDSNSTHFKNFNNFNNNLYEDFSLNKTNESDDLKSELFYFDPNTASHAEWKKLGVKDKTIQTIQNYLSKGGKFYKPEDISKIWGLSPSLANRLLPYVSIQTATKQNESGYKKDFSKSSIGYAATPVQPIDINLADTTAFISLPGIGSKLSKRIITFREKLGGFYSIDQVGETFLLPDSTFQKIKSRLQINNFVVKKININTASIDEMKAHPYIRYNLANAIFQYRNQHGPFNSVAEIKKIMLVNELAFDKMAPYLSVE